MSKELTEGESPASGGSAAGREGEWSLGSPVNPFNSAEDEAKWRALVKPLFLEMYQEGFSEIRIIRDGTHALFERYK